MGHVVIGSAILDADWHGSLSMLPTGQEAEGFLTFMCDTPSAAKAAMAELADLGDVPFNRRDLEPRWHSPRRGSRAVRWLLDHRSRGRELCSRPAYAKNSPSYNGFWSLRRVLGSASTSWR